MNELTYKFKLPFVGSKVDPSRMSFSEKMEWNKKLNEWIKDAKSTWVSQKRKSAASAIKEFRELYNPSEFYCSYHDSKWYKDDTFEIFYKEKKEE